MTETRITPTIATQSSPPNGADVERQEATARPQSADELLERENQRLIQRSENAFRFVDQVAHDFRTPLTVIKEFASILGDGLVGGVSPKQREMLEVVSDRADDLAVMIDDMLDACKLEAGILAPWRRESDVGAILQELQTRLQHKAAMRKVSLRLHVQKDLPRVYCDPEKLGRAVTNLVIRGLKSCGENNSIDIRAGLGDDSDDVVIDVIDDGGGVDEENVRLILERFRHEHGPVAGGCDGLGLAIARELIERNLGRMEVSAGSDSGARFSLTVPILDPRALVVRWLDQVGPLEDRRASVALIVVSTQPTPRSASGVVDEFLQRAFSGDNLAIQAASNKWVVAALGDATEVDHLLRRVEASWAEANRNRPAGRELRLLFSRRHAWRIPGELDEFLAGYRAEFPGDLAADRAAPSLAGESLGS